MAQTSLVVESLVRAMDKCGISDPVVRNGIMAIAAHEGGLGVLKPELGYSKTGNARIRQVFGSRVAGLSENRLSMLKADDKDFFNFVYNGSNSVGRQLGNIPNTDDGYNFRGRGPIQCTGRYNYEHYSSMAGFPEVMEDLDLVNDPVVGAGITVAYIMERYKGDGFEGLLRCVGNNTPDIAARKRSTFAQYSREHRYDISSV